MFGNRSNSHATSKEKNPYHLRVPNKRKANIKICSFTQYTSIMNQCDC